MRKTINKIMSVLLTLALVFTLFDGVCFKTTSTKVNAGEPVDLTDVETTIDTVKTGDNNIINSLTNDVMTIDGVSYKNYTTYEGVGVSASSEQNPASKAIDHNMNERWESEWKVDPQYLTVDLGNVYSVKDIAIFWENASAKEYTIQVSADGIEYQNLTDVTSNSGQRTDNIKLSKEIKIRQIKVLCTKRNMEAYGSSIKEIGIFGNEEQKEVIKELSNLKIIDYFKYTGKYMIYFNEADESAGYNVYIDNRDKLIKTVKASGSYLETKDIEGLEKGTHTLYVVNTDATGQESVAVSTKFNVGDNKGSYTDVPQIYIQTDKTIETDYHENNDVTVSIVDKDGGEYKDLIDSGCNIKIRGNTTSAAPKKPWNIKLSSKQKVLGMNKAKKWCLLANSFDKSLLRNNLAYDFGLDIGLQYNCENTFVEVYVNGTFNGNYLLTEAVEAKKERVNIDAYNAESNDILLELGTRNEEGVDHFTTPTMGVTFDVNDPEKGDDLTDEQVDAKIARVSEYLGKFETALKNADNDYEGLLQYMDEDSFIDFYIANELFKNVDFNFSSTRFYIKDDKLYAGPMWDYDLSSGNCKSTYYTDYYVDGVSYKGYYCDQMKWYTLLLKNPTFSSKLQARYKELQYKIQNIYRADSTAKISINNQLVLYGNSFMRNYLSKDQLGAGWELTNEDGYSYSAESGWTQWQQPIEFLRSWLQNRNAWMCEQWNIDMASAYEEGKKQAETTTEETTTPKPTETTTETTTEKATNTETDSTTSTDSATDNTNAGTSGATDNPNSGTTDCTNAGTSGATDNGNTGTTGGATDGTNAGTTSNTADDKAGVPERITGLTYIPQESSKLTYHFSWVKSKDAMYYNIYINDVFIDHAVTADYDFSAKLFGRPGKYTVSITAVNENGESKETSVLFDAKAGTVEESTEDANSTSKDTNTTNPQETNDSDLTTGAESGKSTNASENETTDKASETSSETKVTDRVSETSSEIKGTDKISEITTGSAISKPTGLANKQTTTAKVSLKRGSITKALGNRAKGKVKLTFKKISGAKYYEVKISSRKDFGKKTTITKKVKKVATNISLGKLKKKKKLYIKVRGVSKNGKVVVYGKWSKPKKVQFK